MARRGDGYLTHARFTDLPGLLEAGDVLVVNTSGHPARQPRRRWPTASRPPCTCPAACPAGCGWSSCATVRLALPTPPRPRTARPGLPPGPTGPAQYGRTRGSTPSRRPSSHLPGGGRAELRLPASAGDSPAGAPVRLWVATARAARAPCSPTWPATAGPSATPTSRTAWPISSYQTVFAEVPGSAEMPSAARPFSAEVITRLVSRGVGIAPFVLHCGVSSPEQHEPPAAEWYRVPPTTAAQINAARRAGGRVIAVGTTAVRALETVADSRGVIHPGEGWTELVVRPTSPSGPSTGC